MARATGKSGSPKQSATGKPDTGLTAGEKAAMKERMRELRAEQARADGEAQLLAKVAGMREPDRGMATRLHAIIKASAPALVPKTWYGMPAYANAEGKVVCFFRDAGKFGDRYATFGFNDAARLDDGAMWPTAFALVGLAAADERKIAALVKRAVG